MNNISNIVIDGNLTRDPESKSFGDGQKVCQLNIAVNHTNDKVSFFTVKCYGKIGEQCQQYLSKGKKVTITGSLKQDRWEDADGSKRERVFIDARTVRFDSPKSNDEPTGSNGEGDYDGYN